MSRHILLIIIFITNLLGQKIYAQNYTSAESILFDLHQFNSVDDSRAARRTRKENLLPKFLELKPTVKELKSYYDLYYSDVHFDYLAQGDSPGITLETLMRLESAMGKKGSEVDQVMLPFWKDYDKTKAFNLLLAVDLIKKSNLSASDILHFVNQLNVFLQAPFIEVVREVFYSRNPYKHELSALTSLYRFSVHVHFMKDVYYSSKTRDEILSDLNQKYDLAPKKKAGSFIRMCVNAVSAFVNGPALP